MKLILLALLIVGSFTLSCDIYSQKDFDDCLSNAAKNKIQIIYLRLNTSVDYSNFEQQMSQLSLTEFHLYSFTGTYGESTNFDNVTKGVQTQSGLQVIDISTYNFNFPNVDFLSEINSNAKNLQIFEVFLGDGSTTDLSPLESVFSGFTQSLTTLKLGFSGMAIQDISIFRTPLNMPNNKFDDLELSVETCLVEDMSGVAAFTEGLQVDSFSIDVSYNQVTNFNPGTFFAKGGQVKKVDIFMGQDDDVFFKQFQTGDLFEQQYIENLELDFLYTAIESFSMIYPMIQNLQVKDMNFWLEGSVLDFTDFDTFTNKQKSAGKWNVDYHNEDHKVNNSAFATAFQGVNYKLLSLGSSDDQNIDVYNSLFFNGHKGVAAQIVVGDDDYKTLDFSPSLMHKSKSRYYFSGHSWEKVTCASKSTTCENCQNDSKQGECKSCMAGYTTDHCTAEKNDLIQFQ